MESKWIKKVVIRFHLLVHNHKSTMYLKVESNVLDKTIMANQTHFKSANVFQTDQSSWSHPNQNNKKCKQIYLP